MIVKEYYWGLLRLASGIRGYIKDSYKWEHLSQVESLERSAFAEAATRYTKRYGSAAAIEFDAEAHQYVVKDCQEHRFTDPHRLIYYLHGVRSRGKQLYGEYLLKHVPFEDGDHVVECGAYDGDFVLALRHAGKNLSLSSFEPSPENAKTAKRNISNQDFLISGELYQTALWSSSNETIEFNLKVDSADSSLIPIDGTTTTIQVKTVCLDEVLSEQRYKLLKLEAEGAEPEVLAGAMANLDKFDFISADVGFERGVRKESTLPDVTNLLTSNGFEVVAVSIPRLVVLFRNKRFEQP